MIKLQFTILSHLFADKNLLLYSYTLLLNPVSCQNQTNTFHCSESLLISTMLDMDLWSLVN